MNLARTLAPLAFCLLAGAGAAKAAEPEKQQSSPIAGSLRAGLEIGTRLFAYSDPLRTSTNLRPYDIAGAPLLVFGGDLRPFTWTHTRILEELSIDAEYAFAPSLSSTTSDGSELETSWDRGNLTLRAPIRIGKDPLAPFVAPRIGYGWLGFSFQETGPLAAEIPTVSYRLVRAGIDGRIRVAGPLSALALFEWLEPIEGGKLYERFRDATIGGIQADLGLALSLGDRTELALSASYTRFFSTFLPIPGDAYVAGGALDEFVGARIAVSHAP